MRNIDKGSEPAELLRYRKGTPGATWEGLPGDVKDAMRRALRREQGGLCAYCCRRVHPGAHRCRIEHVVPQARAPERVLEWANIVLCCDGNKGEPPQHTTCDVHKAHRPLARLDPNAYPEKWIRHCRGGRVDSKNPDDDATTQDLEETLNLNQTRLLLNRRRAVDGLREAMARTPGTWTAKAIRKRILALERSADDLVEFQPTLVYWLRRRLRRAEVDP